MNPVTFTGGARIGESYWDSYNCSWPLATLTIGQAEIILTMPFRNFTLQRNDVVAICGYKGLWSDGIAIQHSSKSIPTILLFWASPKIIATALTSFNYPYLDNTKEDNAFRKHIPSVSVSLISLVGMFLLLLAHEFVMQRGAPDAFLNATLLTLFLGTIYFLLRKQILR